MTADILVIGGGPAGCAAAIQLARAGRKVTLIERERTPEHKVCGEFLSGEALLYLQRLGIDLRALGAIPLNKVRLTGHNHTTERALPFPAMSLTRRCLDAELLRHATEAGANVWRGCSVERLAQEDNTWRANLADGGELTASHVFLASGKHDLRGHPRPAGKQQGMVAFKMYWHLHPEQASAFGNAVELITYPGGYAGLQPVEAGLANLCCLIHADRLRKIGGNWDALLKHMRHASPHLKQRLMQAKPQLLKPLTIASLPYGFIRTFSEGLWYLGDQAVVIPSFTGDGMSLALHSGLLAAEMFLRAKTETEYQQVFARQVRSQVAVATAVSKAMLSLPRASMLLPLLWPSAIEAIAQKTRIRSDRVISQNRFCV